MSDIVVTVPKWFWTEWIAEGDAAGDPTTGEEWGFYLGGSRPDAEPGERCYIVAHGMLRGYAPVTRVVRSNDGRWVICRDGGAVACTLPFGVGGFQGWRKRWWDPSIEKPFPEWKSAGVDMKGVVRPRWARSEGGA